MAIYRVFILFLLIFSANAMAEGLSDPNRIVLLISLDKDKNRPPLRLKKWDINKKLIKIFKKAFKGHQYDLHTVTNADQYQIHHELTNPLNKAVFWVGHANYRDDSPFANATIVDHESKKILEVFSSINPNLQYLGMIGCKTKKIFQNWRESGPLDKNPNLYIRASSKKVDARESLKKAIKKFLKKEDLKSSPSCKKEKGIHLSIKREVSVFSQYEGQAVRILIKNKVIAVLPKAAPGEIQYMYAFYPIDKSLISKNDLKIVVHSGASQVIHNSQEIVLGDLTVHALNNDQFKWKIFANRKGVPFGVDSHIYKYKGPRDIAKHLEMGTPIQCRDEYSEKELFSI